jgi:dolichol-phosphate mannosyltransferase
MDADCSHPPEALPLLVRAIQDKAEMVIGSRYVRGSSVAESWGMLRWLNSRAATLLAWPLTGLSDPMAGFFAMRRELFTQNAHRLNPIGYKIGLELVVKCNCRSVEEVPIHFENRLHGESKLTLAEQLRYLQHLGRLYRFRYYGLTTAIQFAVAGSLGMVLDLLMVVMLLGVVSFPVARASGIVAAMLQNFVVNRFWTFADAKPAPLALQLGVFAGACGIGALINWVVSTTLYFSIPVMHSLPLIPAIAGVLCGFASNYCLSRHIVFRREESV